MEFILSIIQFIFAVVSLVLRDLLRVRIAAAIGDRGPIAYGRNTIDPRQHLDNFAWIVMGVSALMGMPVGWTKEMPSSSRGLSKGAEWMMILWGVLPHLLFAGIAAAILQAGRFSAVSGAPFASPMGPLTNATLGLGGLLQIFMMVNLVLAIFTLLPLYPLEGMRIVKQIVPRERYYKYYDVMREYAPHIYIIGLVLLPALGLRLFHEILLPPAVALGQLLLGRT